MEDSLPGPVPPSLQGKNFPLIFGTVENVPAVQLATPVSGILLEPVGVLAGEELLLKFPIGDTTDFDVSMAKANYQLLFLDSLIEVFNESLGSATAYGAPASVVANYTKMRDSYVQQYTNLQKQCTDRLLQQQQAETCTILRRQKSVNDAREQLGYGTNPVTVLGGEDFPQGPVTVEIGGAVFSGSMNGNKLTIDSRSSDYLAKLAEGAYNAKTVAAADDPCFHNTSIKQYWEWSAQYPVSTNGVWDGNSWETYTY